MKNTMALWIFAGVLMIALSRFQGSYGKIALVPLGEIEGEALKRIQQGLREVFGSEVLISPGFRDLAFSYNSDRGQYHSTPILTRLSSLEGLNEFEKVLGVAYVDLYGPELNFVFGEALGIGGGAAIISLTRLRQEFYGLAPERELFGQRALKEAVHELGHLSGLAHCDNRGCVMYFSNSLADTDRKGSDFCAECQERFEGLAPATGE